MLIIPFPVVHVCRNSLFISKDDTKVAKTTYKNQRRLKTSLAENNTQYSCLVTVHLYICEILFYMCTVQNSC